MQFKKNIIIFFTIFISFILDRITKIFAIDYFLKNNLDIYYFNSFLNFFLTWNQGIAFGLLDSQRHIYHFLSLIIFVIICFLFYLLVISKFLFEKLSYALIIGGALGNFFDRLYYEAVPDFIDFHIKDFHWFTFNVSDIFITLGIIMILFSDIFKCKNTN